MMLILENTRFYDGNGLSGNKTITIDGEVISSIADEARPSATDLIVPGCIDLQIYGAGDKMFSAEPTVESLAVMEEHLLKTGTTGFLACMATNAPEVFNAGIAAAKAHRQYARNFLGLHLEGPYMNPKRLGAHIPEFVRKASLDEVKALLDFGDGIIKMMTLAPELQDDEVIQYLLDNNVIISLGHSDATLEEATQAYNRGIQTTTHLFNAMSPIHHRKPGIPTAVFSHPTAMASIIADGHHLDYEVVKFAHKLLKDRLFLITDAVVACNTGPYPHIKMGDKFVMPDGTLSGSSLTLLQAVKNCVSHCGITLEDAIQMASYIPAKLMGLEKMVGSIHVGQQANMLVLDEELDIKKVIFKGEILSN